MVTAHGINLVEQMVRVCGLAILLCILPNSARAQPALVRGFVTVSTSGEFLYEVNVALIDADESVFGSATNSDGLYVVSGLAPGRYQVQASFVGYTSYTDTLLLAAGEIRDLDISLAPHEQRLETLIVEGEEEGNVSDLVAGMDRIEPADIDHIPGPDVSGDLAAYLTAVPGVVIIGDQGGQFYVRGGEPTQNLALLDGMVIYQPFHILSYYSAFSPEVLRSVDLYAGGFDARYGGRISSVIDAWSRNGNNRRFAASSQGSPFVVGAHIEGPVGQNQNFSFLASVRQSVLEQGATHLISRDIPLAFNDIFAKLQGKTHRHGRIALSGLSTQDRGRIGEDTGRGQPDEVRWTNDAIGARYLFLPGYLPILAEFMISVSRHTNEIGDRNESVRESETGRLNLETNITHYTPYTNIRWGMFARTLTFTSDLAGLFQDYESSREYVTEAGFYLAPHFQINERTTLSPSIRIHNFPSKGAVYVEPRLRGQWGRGPHTFSGAAGLYHQEIVGISDRRDAASVFTAWSATPTGQGVPQALHLIAGYRRDLAWGVEMAAEGYLKRIRDLYLAEWTPRPRLTTTLQQGRGRIFGLDLRLEMRRRNVYGYVNYGLSTVRYTATQPELEIWFGNATYSFRPAHDRRHQVSALLTAEIADMTASVLWQFGSGRPFSRALGYDGFLLMDGRVDVFEEAGERRVIYERPFNGVLPSYHRLDVSLERSFTVGLAEVIAQLSVINAYDRANIFYLDIFTLERANQLPVIPSLGLKVSV